MSVASNEPIDKNLLLHFAEGHIQKIKDYLGQNLVLYFYPKDNTPGCTKESQQFAEMQKKFTKLDTVILGISRDSFASHEKFKQKFCLPFDLVSDVDEILCQYFNVIKMKNMYGKKVRGIERSTFLIDKKGILRKEWRNVKVDGHVDDVLTVVKTI